MTVGVIITGIAIYLTLFTFFMVEFYSVDTIDTPVTPDRIGYRGY